MSDATVSVEARIIDQMSGALRSIQHEMARLEKTTFDSTNGVKKEMDALKRASESSSNAIAGGMKRIGGAVLGAAAAYVSFRAAVGLATSAIESSLTQQKIGRGLEFATGSAEAGARAFGFVRDEAERLGLDLRASATEFTKLSAAARGTALEGKATRDIFTGVSEAATVLGLSADQAGGALNAIQQMISKGTVAAEELRGQLGERLPGAFQAAARAMGKSTEELGKMLEQGQIVASDFLPKFAVELHKTFGADAVNASKQGQAGINRFNTAVFEAKSMLGDALLPALLEVTAEISSILKTARESGDLKEFFEVARVAAQAAADTVHGLVISISAISRFIKGMDFTNSALGYSKLYQGLDSVDNSAGAAAKSLGDVADAQAKVNASGSVVSPSKPSLSKDQEKSLLKLQLEVEAARLSSMEDGLKKRLAIEDLEYKFRLKEAGDFGQARQQIEILHAQNVANIRMDAIVKAREKERAELLKEQKDAVAADEKRTEQIYKAREELALAQAGDNEMEELKAKQAAELAAIAGNETAITTLKRAHALQRDQLADEMAEKDKKREKEVAEQKQQAVAGMLGGLSALARQANMKDRENRIRYKALAIAEATVNTYLAATKALSSAPPPFNYVAMAGVIASGLAQVNQIKEQKFAMGGPVNGPSHAGGGVRAELEGGEFVLSRRDVRNLGGMEGVQAMRRGGGSSFSPTVVINLSGGATPADAEMIREATVQELQRLATNMKRIEYEGVRPDA